MNGNDGHPPCPMCGCSVERRQDEPANNFAKRRYCRRRCEREARSLSAVASHPPGRPPPWPTLTEPNERLSGQCYAPHELHLRSQPGRIAQPATVVPSGTALGGEV